MKRGRSGSRDYPAEPDLEMLEPRLVREIAMGDRYWIMWGTNTIAWVSRATIMRARQTRGDTLQVPELHL
jgi:hypothetical protein